MGTNLESYKKDLSKLKKMGRRMTVDLALRTKEKKGKLDNELTKLKKSVNRCFEKDYQLWYTESHAVIRQLIPERLEEFEVLYKGEPRRKDISATTYNIQDWMTGVRSGNDFRGEKYYDDFAIVSMKFNAQLEMINAAESRFESTIYDLRQIVQADLFDSELEAARELLKNGFLRGAGAVAGVVLEKHLSEVCANHAVRSRKRNPTISDYNDLLKSNNVIDVPTWRFIQRLGDLRNLCVHNKEREPTKEEVDELISGAEKIPKTIF